MPLYHPHRALYFHRHWVLHRLEVINRRLLNNTRTKWTCSGYQVQKTGVAEKQS